ncbi:MAG: hypothetical protein JST19_17855 [Bacteroidetes bacterium]|nr:hypothetical protein [Bacteroidota bacterium]
MKIIDLDGKVIEIENLDLAIMQADDYRHMRHNDPALTEFDKKQQAYWNDVYQKLLKLRAD